MVVFVSSLFGDRALRSGNRPSLIPAETLMVAGPTLTRTVIVRCPKGTGRGGAAVWRLSRSVRGQQCGQCTNPVGGLATPLRICDT